MLTSTPLAGALLLVATLCAGPARAEEQEPVAALWVELAGPAEHAVARSLGLGFVEGQDGAWWRMDGPPGVEAALDAAGLAWRPAVQARAAAIDDYHDADEVLAALDALAQAHPDLAERLDLGWSVEGRPIRGLRLGRAAHPRAQWRIVGTHHGDEWAASEVALDVARRLVGLADTDPELDALLDTDVVWVVPQLNPDGFEQASRYNHNSVDLNRNYDYAWSDSEWRPGEAPFSEPETRALRSLHAWTPVAAGLSFHAGAANIGWVWNYVTTPSEDDVEVRGLAELYADACGQPGFWQTNGADWYITHGDTTDWAYGRLGTLDFTVEVSVDKIPDGDELPALRDAHWPAVRALVLGVDPAAGQVVDAASGMGLPGTITPLDGGWPQVTGPDGRFARVLDGPRIIEVSSPGFAPVQSELSPGQDLWVELETRDLLSLLPSPRLLRGASTATFRLDRASEAVVLSRPGHASVPATPTAEGWTVDTTDLAPGPWDLELDDGVAPRALFVGEVDDAVSASVRALAGTSLALQGRGFGQGTRAWAVAGPARGLVPLTVLQVDEDSLSVDLGGLDLAGPAPVDVVLLSNARQLVVLDVGDVLDEPGTLDDTGPTDSGDPLDGGGLAVQPVGCGCGAGPGSTPPLLLLFLLPLLHRRSRS